MHCKPFNATGLPCFGCVLCRQTQWHWACNQSAAVNVDQVMT